MIERIRFDAKIMGSRPCIRGMRIPVSVIVGQVAHGAAVDEIFENYPDLEREDIQATLDYDAQRTRDDGAVTSNVSPSALRHFSGSSSWPRTISGTLPRSYPPWPTSWTSQTSAMARQA